jgi:hypothetical protein
MGLYRLPSPIASRRRPARRAAKTLPVSTGSSGPARAPDEDGLRDVDEDRSRGPRGRKTFQEVSTQDVRRGGFAGRDATGLIPIPQPVGITRSPPDESTDPDQLFIEETLG